MEKFQEHPQSLLLTDSIMPVMRRLHPDSHFVIGSNSGIYWKWTDPPLEGCKAPDWYYVPGVEPMVAGQRRRSYVMWWEHIPPTVVLEFASRDGSEERDRTPEKGKFWVYEHGIRAPYYGIFEIRTGKVEVYHLVDSRYELLSSNAQGRYPIPPMRVELGVWHSEFFCMQGPWLRWWDTQGNMLPIGHELAEQQRQRAEQAHQQAEQQRQRADRLAAQLRKAGIEPENE